MNSNEVKNADVGNAMQFGESKLYKILLNSAIAGIFVTAGLLILGVILQFLNPVLSLTLAILAILCLSAILMLPWIKKLNQGALKKLSITFIVFTGVCCLLWIICAILIFSMYMKGKSGAEIPQAVMTGYLRTIQIVAIISFQFITATSIASIALKYKKSFIAFQIVSYISFLFVDLYLSGLLVCMTFNSSGDATFNTSILKFLFSNVMIALFVMFVVFSIISAGVVRRIERVRGVNKVDADNNQNTNVYVDASAQGNNEAKESVETRLTKLKEMLDAGLITEQEYNEKRDKILDEI